MLKTYEEIILECWKSIKKRYNSIGHVIELNYLFIIVFKSNQYWE